MLVTLKNHQEHESLQFYMKDAQKNNYFQLLVVNIYRRVEFEFPKQGLFETNHIFF